MSTTAEQAPPGAASAYARQLPSLDPGTAFYWTSGEDGQLRICRCDACGHYSHPPLPRCPVCTGSVTPQPVSGEGRVASYTINRQQWLPGLPVPFVYAAVELKEQKELYVLTNIIDCPVEDVTLDMPVTVTFEHLEDVYLPLFRPAETADVG